MPADLSGWQRILTQNWLRRGPLAGLLWPLSLVYGALVAVRRYLYRHELLRPGQLPVPVVVIGNVVAGGAGKTPLTITLVRHWQAQGRHPGVVSRGHGRRDAQPRMVQSDNTAQEVGDEPLLIQRSTGVPVAVGRQRVRAALLLLEKHPQTDLIVCDDGLQHLALARDIEICVFDERGTGNGWLLPAGPLREPWPRRVDWVVQSLDASAGSTPSKTSLAGSWPIRRSLAPLARCGDGRVMPLSELARQGRPVLALAGIARPERFFAMLRAQGITLSKTLPLPDHHDFDGFLSLQDSDSVLVCTEKDAVKLWRIHPQAWAVGLEVQPDDRWLQQVDQRLRAVEQAKLSSLHGHTTA